MKTYCKHRDTHIEDAGFNLPAVVRCIKGAPGHASKLGRHDFRRLLASTGAATEAELAAEYEAGKYDRTNRAIEALAETLTEDIRRRDLRLEPVRQFTRADGISGKVREICQETPRQQVHEYILTNALMPLFQAKFLPCQYGSIPGRGPEMGKRKIERILRRLCKGGKTDAIQGDVRKAYPSTKTACVLTLLRRDVGKNPMLLWYAEAVMANYPDGALLIGGYFSSYAYNYVMSYLLRYLLSLYKSRRGKRIRLVMAVVCYADDFLIFGHKSQLIRAMKQTEKWAKDSLGLTIKPAWKVMHLPGFEAEKANHRAKTRKRTVGIDMMGYVVRGTYTTIRGRIFVRIRRQLIRAWRELQTLGYVPWWRALKLTASKGRFRHSDSTKFCGAYHVREILKAAEKSISAHAKGARKYETGVPCAA